jgi:hypothetical protein
MHPSRRTRASLEANTLRPTKPPLRKLSLGLYELEPESGEDELMTVDLGLDQLED